ncbi:FKBP-type peptidyl-prolyl cis-trans isomerase [Geobacter sp. DSM 9736]|uniref:FKBP-type peptidyl-prolyl cis-trans isomerase n=1 Tax=Geobacter sp. DSM 9736 TaxID=1277350 RepID=UPI000B51361C|nr:FKBP-type peptidyl-prolyl cis-trans isomerase [Geobacter sp. DSM 9736]SNB45000.1 peptidylprolyl isomerase [Geobacter sp. DSM 9736]
MRGVEKLIVVLLLIAGIIIPACAQKEQKPAGDNAKQPAAAAQAAVKTPSGLSYVDLVTGTGAAPTPGKQVKVHYTGWLEDGTKFDSSLDSGQPFVFTLGVGQVIPGWDEGVQTMKTGGKRKLIVPPQLGYGAAGAGGVIPPNATLIFEVELLEVQN